ncbi:MAG TPA: lysophospholipid acyltransferase family protein [Chthoniobacteraceae bacterium]|nr:Lipid biosynthesis acyltransferase [Chthoniobacter sp.]HEV7866800.1 lysophospholipid acyltransferase family protein [Chthoniobacteraceae bacterium]
MSPWKSFRYRLERLGVQLLATAVPRLSRRSCVRLAAVLGDLAYRLDARGRKVALANLQCAFPEWPEAQRAATARASYCNFVRTMLDLFWAPNLTAETWTRWLEVEGADALRARLAAAPRGTIMMCVHQGNWEWASLAFGFLGFPTTIVAENFKNPHLTEIFSRLRQVSGHTIIAQDSSILRMLKLVKRGGATGMLVDLSLPPTQAATVIEGFGMKMCVPLLHAVLAQRAGALLLPVTSEPLPDGRCRVAVHEPLAVPADATLQEIAQHCWEALEPTVRARPDLYLWPYKHFRYRPRDSGQQYPFYANESSKFEKLWRQVPDPRSQIRSSGTHV